MTLEELESLPVSVLTCAQIAPILQANAYTIHETAIQRPGLLGFPVVVMGRRVKIPKAAFIRYMRGA